MAEKGEHDGDVVLTPDPRHRLPGRGAWLHPDIACFEQAVRRKAFSRALRLQARPDVTALAAHLGRSSPEAHAHSVSRPTTGTGHQNDQQHQQDDQRDDQIDDQPTEGGSDANERPMSTAQ